MELSQFKTVEQLAAAIKSLLLEDMMANKGWIGTAWRKDPLRLGYSSDQSEQKSDTSATAGTNILTSTAVPAGEIWIIEGISARDVDNVPSKILLVATVNGISITLEDQQTVAAAEFVTWSGAITLSENDTISANIYGCTLNDDIYLQYHGRQIDIDQ